MKRNLTDNVVPLRPESPPTNQGLFPQLDKPHTRTPHTNDGHFGNDDAAENLVLPRPSGSVSTETQHAQFDRPFVTALTSDPGRPHESDGYVDDPDHVELQRGVDVRRPRHRYLPIEADSERQKIEADPTINPDHSGTLNDLKLLLTSDAEKDRVFRGTLNQELQVILDDLLKVAIAEIEIEHATVVGVINVLTLRMLDICVALRRDELERIIW